MKRKKTHKILIMKDEKEKEKKFVYAFAHRPKTKTTHQNAIIFFF